MLYNMAPITTIAIGNNVIIIPVIVNILADDNKQPIVVAFLVLILSISSWWFNSYLLNISFSSSLSIRANSNLFDLAIFFLH